MIARFLPVIGNSLRCTGSWGTQILNDTKKNLQKVPVGGTASWGSASWGKCQLGD